MWLNDIAFKLYLMLFGFEAIGQEILLAVEPIYALCITCCPRPAARDTPSLADTLGRDLTE